MASEEDRSPKESQERIPEIAPPLPIAEFSGFYGQLGSNNPPARMEWPELIDSMAEEAEKKIKEEMPHLQIQVVPADSFITMDLNENRVRIYLDTSGKVAKVPRIG